MSWRVAKRELESRGDGDDTGMSTFEFTIFASGLDSSADDIETRLFEAGCDDATISFQTGWVVLDFAREASSIDTAIASAVESIRSVGAMVEFVVRLADPEEAVASVHLAERTGTVTVFPGGTFVATIALLREIADVQPGGLTWSCRVFPRFLNRTMRS
jgi:hypothetical protein